MMAVLLPVRVRVRGPVPVKAIDRAVSLRAAVPLASRAPPAAPRVNERSVLTPGPV